MADGFPNHCVTCGTFIPHPSRKQLYCSIRCKNADKVSVTPRSELLPLPHSSGLSSSFSSSTSPSERDPEREHSEKQGGDRNEWKQAAKAPGEDDETRSVPFLDQVDSRLGVHAHQRPWLTNPFPLHSRPQSRLFNPHSPYHQHHHSHSHSGALSHPHHHHQLHQKQYTTEAAVYLNSFHHACSNPHSLAHCQLHGLVVRQFFGRGKGNPPTPAADGSVSEPGQTALPSSISGGASARPNSSPVTNEVECKSRPIDPSTAAPSLSSSSSISSSFSLPASSTYSPASPSCGSSSASLSSSYASRPLPPRTNPLWSTRSVATPRSDLLVYPTPMSASSTSSSATSLNTLATSVSTLSLSDARRTKRPNGVVRPKGKSTATSISGSHATSKAKPVGSGIARAFGSFDGTLAVEIIPDALLDFPSDGEGPICDNGPGGKSGIDPGECDEHPPLMMKMAAKKTFPSTGTAPTSSFSQTKGAAKTSPADGSGDAFALARPNNRVCTTQSSFPTSSLAGFSYSRQPVKNLTGSAVEVGGLKRLFKSSVAAVPTVGKMRTAEAVKETTPSSE